MFSRPHVRTCAANFGKILGALTLQQMAQAFDAIVIGSGQAGPFLAVRLANAGMKVAIIERKYFGGTCVNTGCIPTKTMVASAYAAHMARRAADYGVVVDGAVTVDMRRVKARKDAITLKDRAAIESMLRKEPNCTVYQGSARFESAHEVSVGGRAAYLGTNLYQRGRARDSARDARPGSSEFPDELIDDGGRLSSTAPGHRGRKLRWPRVRADVPAFRQRSYGD